MKRTGPEKEGPFTYLDAEKIAMRRWLVMVVLLGAVVMFGTSAVSAARMVVSGVIVNWKEVMARVPAGAYLQLVKIEDKMKGNTDAQGLSAFESKYPKITVRTNGSFKVDVKDLPSGEYIVALQRAMPRVVDGNPIASGTPLLITEEGKPLLIKVPGEFPLDVGKVDVGVRAK